MDVLLRYAAYFNHKPEGMMLIQDLALEICQKALDSGSHYVAMNYLEK